MTSKVEVLARAICASRGIVADAQVTRFHMAVVDGLTILPPTAASRPAWEEYAQIAELALKLAKQGEK